MDLHVRYLEAVCVETFTLAHFCSLSKKLNLLPPSPVVKFI